MPVSSSEAFLGELRTDDTLRSLASVDEDGPLFAVAVAVEAEWMFLLLECTAVEDKLSSLLAATSDVHAASCLL